MASAAASAAGATDAQSLLPINTPQNDWGAGAAYDPAPTTPTWGNTWGGGRAGDASPRQLLSLPPEEAGGHAPRPPPLTRRLSLRTRGEAAVTPEAARGERGACRELMCHTLLVCMQLILALAALITPIFNRDVTGG